MNALYKEYYKVNHDINTAFISPFELDTQRHSQNEIAVPEFDDQRCDFRQPSEILWPYSFLMNMVLSNRPDVLYKKRISAPI